MKPDAEPAWRTCPGCGYLVPGTSATCLRCHADLGAAGSPGVVPPPAPDASAWSAPTVSSTEAPPGPMSQPGGDRAGFVPPPVWPTVSTPGAGSAPPAGGEYLPDHRDGSRHVRRAWWIAVALVVALALIGGVLRATVFADGPSYPATWDARLGDLPQAVARLRKLNFEHAVPVRFLSDNAFKKETAFDPGSSPGATKQLKRLTESLRATGLVTGNVDLGRAVNDEQQSAVLAFYDPDAKEIVIRGTGPLDVAHKVTLAHELTHVLQDQHFDLNRLEHASKTEPDGSSDAFRAFIEGDAVRIEDKYRAGLSKADTRKFDASRQADAARADGGTVDVPAFVSLSFTAPYRYGPPAVGVVAADGGNANVDRGFRSGSFTERLFLEPNSVLHRQPEPKLAPPALGKGEKASGRTDRFGAFSTYLLLASRLDAGDALEAATFVRGGRMRTVRADGRTCVRGVVLGPDGAANQLLAGRFRDWAAALPDGMAEIGRRGQAVTFFSCDPGVRSTLASPDPAIDRAGTLLQIHDELEAALVADFADAGIPARRAECAALGLSRSPEIALVVQKPESDISAKDLTDAITAAAPRVRRRCGF